MCFFKATTKAMIPTIQMEYGQWNYSRMLIILKIMLPTLTQLKSQGKQERYSVSQ